MKKYYYYSSIYMIPLELTKEHVEMGSHQGECYYDIIEIMKEKDIEKQLENIDQEELKRELMEIWSKEDLVDHKENLAKFLWIACGDIHENPELYEE